ncbi:Mitotic spindle checkpoint component mad3 [Sparassis crispa]|uniref:Mitotic spindle checkpoint component mad3 n=1 Tax=Sparassis crispa TaxID=139825 RepID=A0A401H2V7_9APHY|nr:Mitotic spindle checkpoint component mad3 [Sparassis crispa]GBE88748.1 Mitotic spindle checkpoint component mad3 [Sparassis crispa]
MSDVFDDNEPVIVDCDVLEAAKENIQPLAAGRRVTALSAILSTPHAQRESRLASTRNRLRINVEVALEDEDDDPLEAYCRFVYWTVENYPQGHSAESGLLELLEEATRVLKDNRGGIWRGDMRYLKLWVLYASYVEKPAIIFKFLLVNEIGTSHALLYEEFANVLERAGRRNEADETYLLGIARKASPAERLESKHRDFQKRMMASFTHPAPVSEPAPPLTSSTSTKRSVLAETATSTPSTSRHQTRSATRNASVTGDVFTTPPSAVAPHSNARLEIFLDPSGSPENDPTLAETSWPELGTRKSRIKENIPEVKKAAGTTLRQPGRPQRTVAAAAPRMAVYRDPDPDQAADAQEMPPPPVPATRKHEKAKSSITVFRDEDEKKSQPSSSSKKCEMSSSMIFRDEDEVDGTQGPSTQNRDKIKGAITVFCDEVEVEVTQAATAEKHEKAKISTSVYRDKEGDTGEQVSSTKKHEKGKSSITVFRDEDGDQGKQTSSPSKFTPFRDEESPVPSSTSSTSTALSTVMKVKAVGARREAPTSTEAEALRKDPFKNYSADEKPVADQD